MNLDLASSEAAEAAFYEAFENQDLGTMERLWDDADDVTCVHPMGPTLVGRTAVMESWQALLGGGQRLRFTARLVARYSVGELAVHHVHEHIHHGPDLTARSTVIATNVYRARDGRWRLVAHHGSPVNRTLPPQTPTPSQAVH